MPGATLYDKLFDSHVVRTESDGTALLYIDRHRVHEVTSPQAYEGLRLAESSLGGTLLREVVGRLGWPRLNRGFSAEACEARRLPMRIRGRKSSPRRVSSWR